MASRAALLAAQSCAAARRAATAGSQEHSAAASAARQRSLCCAIRAALARCRTVAHRAGHGAARRTHSNRSQCCCIAPRRAPHRRLRRVEPCRVRCNARVLLDSIVNAKMPTLVLRGTNHTSMSSLRVLSVIEISRHDSSSCRNFVVRSSGHFL